LKKHEIGAGGNDSSQNFDCSFCSKETMIHKIVTLRSSGLQSLGNIKPNEYVCIRQFKIVSVCREKNGILEPGFC